MQGKCDFEMKDCLTLEWTFLIVERQISKGEERFHTFIDEHIRRLVRQSVNGGNVGAVNQVFQSPLAQNIPSFFEEAFKLLREKLIEKIEYYMTFLS